MTRGTTGKKQTRRSFGRVELRPSGRYRAGYIGPDGKLHRPPSTFDSKDDAIAWLAARRAEIQLNVWAPDIVDRSVAKRAVPTFEEYAQRHYQYILDGTLYPTFGRMPI